MAQLEELCSCPTCGEVFDTKHGVKVHHVMAHDESLAKEERVCENCGEKFKEFQSRIERGKGRFCSRQCKHDIGRVEVECSRCGTTVKRPKHRADRYDKEYCSRDCYLAEKEEGGEKAPGWVDGRMKDIDYTGAYGTRFRENRSEVVARDGHQCRICGMMNEKHVEKYGMQLHVHHIVPVAEFNIEANAHDKDNLVTLCLECHREWEGIPVVPGGVNV